MEVKMRSLDGIDLRGKKVLLRPDINSPVDPVTKKIVNDNRIVKTIPAHKAAFSAKRYSTYVAGMNLYIAERVITATAPKMIHPRKDFIFSETPRLLGLRSSTSPE